MNHTIYLQLLGFPLSDNGYVFSGVCNKLPPRIAAEDDIVPCLFLWQHIQNFHRLNTEKSLLGPGFSERVGGQQNSSSILYDFAAYFDWEFVSNELNGMKHFSVKTWCLGWPKFIHKHRRKLPEFHVISSGDSYFVQKQLRWAHWAVWPLRITSVSGSETYTMCAQYQYRNTCSENHSCMTWSCPLPGF